MRGAKRHAILSLALRAFRMASGEWKRMTIASIVKELDAEIARLQQVRALLSDRRYTGIASIATTGRPRGRKSVARKKRTLSPEARQKIAEAQRKRWASQKRAAK